VIVGGGVNGASLAFHLAKAGMKDVVVVEKSHMGAGASGKSGALVRTHYTNEPETRLSFESLTYFKHWKDLVGGECGYQPIGLLVFTPPQSEKAVQAHVEMHRRVGVISRLLSPQEARELDPFLSVDDVTQVVYEPESGFADPNATTFAFMQAAQQLGVGVKLGSRVTRILTTQGRISGVETEQGTISSPRVVVIAGAWANQLFEPLDIDLGLIPVRGQVVVFRWPTDESTRHPHPTCIDRVNRLWARPTDGTCLLTGTNTGLESGDPDTYSESVDQAYIERCRTQIARRFPVMQRCTTRGNWACMMMRSPDERPLIGALPAYEGLFCMTGDSGTSFKTAPAIGKGLSELILTGQARTVDLFPFRPTRFAEGQAWRDEFSPNDELQGGILR
jgi:sarcosine oxidase subunit beta